eukprot:12728285-Alexandrium_andersonii.AAC.1
MAHRLLPLPLVPLEDVHFTLCRVHRVILEGAEQSNPVAFVPAKEISNNLRRLGEPVQGREVVVLAGLDGAYK